MEPQRREAIIGEYLADLEAQLLRARLDVYANTHNWRADRVGLQVKVQIIQTAIADVLDGTRENTEGNTP
ncbi:MAG: hypothetical protein LC769_06575 [Chloroflexi bacterium]|nr:hypothetical protein [Chloroflexota bacterium]